MFWSYIPQKTDPCDCNREFKRKKYILEKVIPLNINHVPSRSIKNLGFFFFLDCEDRFRFRFRLGSMVHN